MDSGYIGVETHDDRPGMIRLLLLAHMPEPATYTGSPTRVRYAARFNDRDAAMMHTHEVLKRRLVDADARLYRVSPEHAIGAIEALELSHRDVFLDPDFDADSRQTIDEVRARTIRIRQRWNRFFEIAGYIGIGILLFNLLVLSLA